MQWIQKCNHSFTDAQVCRGYGGFGALGHSVYHRELLPRLVEGNWTGKISHIATSGAHTSAITDTGFQFTYFNIFFGKY